MGRPSRTQSAVISRSGANRARTGQNEGIKTLGKAKMNNYENETYRERLRKRRGEIIRTLEHVRNEQRAVDDNKDWIDQAAYESRLALLGSLINWYLKETERIDDALVRIAEERYGVCRGCREPIEPHRLETAPEAAFCAECQRSREDLAHP